MKKLSVFLNKFGGLFAALALFVGVSISNSACAIIWHIRLSETIVLRLIEPQEDI